MKIEKHLVLKHRIIRELKELRSPDEIAGRMKRENSTPRVEVLMRYTNGSTVCMVQNIVSTCVLKKHRRSNSLD